MVRLDKAGWPNGCADLGDEVGPWPIRGTGDLQHGLRYVKISTYIDVANRQLIATLPAGGCPNDDSGEDEAEVVFSPNGTTLAVINGAICLWDVAARRQVATLTDPGGDGATSGTFSPDGQTLAVTGSGEITYLWNVASARLAATLTEPPQPDTTAEKVPAEDAVAFSPDGATLAVGNTQGSTYLWDLPTKRVIATLNDPQAASLNGALVSGGAQSLAFSPDGRLAAGDADGGVYLWDVAARRVTASVYSPVGSFECNSSSQPGEEGMLAGPIGVSIAFSADGARLVVSERCATVTSVWRASGGSEYTRYATLPSPVPHGDDIMLGPAVLSPDGRMVAAVATNANSGDSDIYLWRIS